VTQPTDSEPSLRHQASDSGLGKQTGETIVEVDHLSGGYVAQQDILSNVSFTLTRGQILCVIGQSGCGKSTLLRALLGMLPHVNGSIKLFGEPRCDEHRRRTGMLFQHGALLGSLTVGDNIALPVQEHGYRDPKTGKFIHPSKDERDLYVNSLLKRVGLSGCFNKYPDELSGGMKKRAALCRAIASKAELLLCDEPSSGLDPIVAAGLDELLLSVRNDLGISMVVISHDLASVKKIADYAIMIDAGQVIARGTIDELEGNPLPKVENFFLRKPPKSMD